ncbi:hypothetical protein RhiirA1_484695 [Rhizophagus irregularis]|nr:hypothetical protein RhiirA1_484695 [Rhizophagus irregularis]PKY31038.1 hypothetical protein RhiirB3_448437 [Rhizophagus irregularis]
MKEQEKYKKRFTNSLKNNKNKWNYTNNRFESKSVVSKHCLKRRGDILKKHYISNKELDEYFLILKKKKEATFEREDNEVAEQSTSIELEIREQDKVLPWQEILNKFVPITRHEFHRGLNSVRDLDTLKLFYDGVRKKRRDHNVSYSYVKNQCDIKARKIKGAWY